MHRSAQQQPTGHAGKEQRTPKGTSPATTPEGEEVDIGVKADARAELAKELCGVLADTYTLYLKTHNFHWNVTGPTFESLHLMFERQYRELAEAVDEVAERVRALGHPAPGTYKLFTELATIKETEGNPKAEEMVRLLMEGHETVTRACHRAFRIADAANDQPTADLLTQRMAAHEKAAWMLRATLE